MGSGDYSSLWRDGSTSEGLFSDAVGHSCNTILRPHLALKEWSVAPRRSGLGGLREAIHDRLHVGPHLSTHLGRVLPQQVGGVKGGHDGHTDACGACPGPPSASKSGDAGLGIEQELRSRPAKRHDDIRRDQPKLLP